ncbi:mechanosensitive ion channel family protein [Bacteroidales bacterium OttesenSCG-928-J19]|nr:mechanosensitive ion channel family protein [Bacteroidales bacterium OttesenSCG-928-J19]
MLNATFLGNSLEEWGISLIIIVGVMLLSKLLSIFNRRVVDKLVKKTKTNFDDLFARAVESPILFAVILIGIWVALYRLHFSEEVFKAIRDSYTILIILNATWLIARIVGVLLEIYFTRRKDKSNKTDKHSLRMMPIVKRTLLTVVWIVGLVTALGNIGINISALLGTLGIGGIAFALAAQDTVKNIFGAFTIFADRSFSIGDTIRVDGFEGVVLDVGVRSTRLRTFDKRLVTIPNYKIADASVVNISAEPMRRVVIDLGLTYDTTPEQMKRAIQILREEIPAQVEFVSSKDGSAVFSNFADSALVITYTYFIEKRGDIKQTTSNVNMEILTRFTALGLNFAFPTQTLYVEGQTQKEVVN